MSLDKDYSTDDIQQLSMNKTAIELIEQITKLLVVVDPQYDKDYTKEEVASLRRKHSALMFIHQNAVKIQEIEAILNP